MKFILSIPTALLIFLWLPVSLFAGVSEQIIHDDQGVSYRTVINGPGSDGLYVSSLPILNIIEDKNNATMPVHITPTIAVDTVSLYQNGSQQPLDWCSAEPVLKRALALMPSLYEVYPPSEFEVINLNQGIFLLPGTFEKFVFSDSAQNLRNYERRVEIYTKVFLDLFTRRAWLQRDKKPVPGHYGDRARENLATGAEYYLHLLDDARTQEGVNAALAHGQKMSKSEVLKKVQKRTAGSKSALGFLDTGIEIVQAVREVNRTIAILSLALAMEDLAAENQAVLNLLSLPDSGLDPAMKAGAQKAMKLWQALATERLAAAAERIKAVAQVLGKKAMKKMVADGVKAALKQFPSVASLSPALLGGASGLVTVAMETWSTSQLGMYLGGIATAGKYISSRTEELADRNPGATDFPALIRFNHYASYLSYLRLNDELFRNISLAKVIAYTAKDWFNPGLKKSLTQTEAQTGQVLQWEDDVQANLASLMRELQQKYVGPPCRKTVMDAAVTPSGMTIVALVDSSGSMEKYDPRNLRISGLKMMIDSLSEGHSLGIIDFDDKAHTLVSPEMLGLYGGDTRQQLRRAASRIDADGGTNIRDGLTLAASLIPPGRKGVIILLTDGKDKNWRGQNDMVRAGIKVHTIALSDAADQAGLSRLSSATGGEAEIARNAGDLQRIFGVLFGLAEQDEVVLIREGTIRQGGVQNFPLLVEQGQGLIECRVSWPGSNIDLTAVSPNGRQYSIQSAVAGGYGIEGDTYDLIRIKNPMPGNWNLRLQGVEITPGGEPFTVRAAARDSAIRTRWEIKPLVPEMGENCSFSLSSQSNVNWQTAEVIRFDHRGVKSSKQVTLSSIAAMLGGAGGQTIYSWRPDSLGVNRFHLEVKGVLPDGSEVMRSLDRTVRVAAPGQGVRRKYEIDPFIRR